MRNEITAALAIALTTVFSSAALASSDGTPPMATQPDAGPALTATRLGRGGPYIQVRVYNAGIEPAADQTVALRAAATILAAAGIGTTWLVCADAATDANPTLCATPLESSELSVRLVQLPGMPSARGELRLGYSLVDTSEGRGKLATIYVDRVRWLAAQAGGSAPVLIGFAVAHELGHLLLGTNAHAASGLMRAVWSRTELQRGDAADWLFGRSEAARMRTSLLRQEGLRSFHPDVDATGCSAPIDGASSAAANPTGCARSVVFAPVRGVAARPDR